MSHRTKPLASPTFPGAPRMSARLAGLFVAALLGALAASGVAVSGLGPVALVAYVALVVVLLGALVRRARALRAPAGPEGRTCACCTSTVYDPVEVR